MVKEQLEKLPADKAQVVEVLEPSQRMVAVKARVEKPLPEMVIVDPEAPLLEERVITDVVAATTV